MGSCLSKSDVEEDGMVSSPVPAGRELLLFHFSFVRGGASELSGPWALRSGNQVFVDVKMADGRWYFPLKNRSEIDIELPT